MLITKRLDVLLLNVKGSTEKWKQTFKITC